MAEEVKLEIGIESDQAIKSLENLEKSASKSISGMEKAFSGLKTVATAAVAFLAGKEIFDFFAEGVKGAVAQEQAFAKLETQLQATGEAGEEATKQFGDLADELESTTKFGDDAVISAAALAKAYGLTNDQAIELTKAAADLASVTGESLESAVTTLSESYSGNVKAIGKLVPEVKALTKEQLAAGDAVKIIASRFKGAAADEINTYQGAIIQAGNAFDNFRKAFGSIITENKALTAAIGGIGKLFGQLQNFVENNAEAIGTGLTRAIEFFVAAISGATSGMRFFVEGIGGIAIAVQELAKDIIDGLFPVAAIIDNLAGNNDLSEIFTSASTQVALTTKATGEFFVKISDGMEKGQEDLDEFAQSVFNAGEASAKSGDKSKKAQDNYTRAVVQSADEIAKLKDEAAKFLQSITEQNATELEKITLKAAEQFNKIDDLAAKGALTAAQVAESRVKVAEIASKAQLKIQEDQDKKTIEEAKRVAEEARAEIEKAGADPIRFAIAKIEIPPLQVDIEDAKLASAATGFLGNMLSGAAGAKSAITAGASAFADALVPGIGGAVGGVVAKLAEGPEATKKFIKEFIAAIPDIMDAIAESMPVVVEVFVDTMVNKGGAVRIAAAIARAMSGEAILKNLGRQLGIDMGSAFNADVIAGKISGAFNTAATAFVDSLKGAFEDIFVRMPESFATAGSAFLQTVVEFFAVDMPSYVAGSFSSVFSFFADGLTEAVSSAFASPINFFSVDMPNMVYDAFKPVFDFFDNLKIDAGGAASSTGIPGAKEAVSFATRFQKALFTGGLSEIPGFSGGGLVYAASGAALPSRGLDTVPVMAQRGEMILNQSQQSSLFGMINSGTSGGLAADILERIAALLSEPQTTNVTATVDGKAIADIVLQQNRQRSRLTA